MNGQFVSIKLAISSCPSSPSPENTALHHRHQRRTKHSPPTTCPPLSSFQTNLHLKYKPAHSAPLLSLTHPSQPSMLATSPSSPIFLFQSYGFSGEGCLMSASMEQQELVVGVSAKYFCKICKKGFGCGRALGGHMRAHGINGEDGVGDDDDDDDDNAGGWEEKNNVGLSSAGDRRMYTLRANPNRLKSCRVCENCGEEFSSWKSFLEHGRCGYDEEDDEEDEEDDEMFVSPAEEVEMGRWSKGKRSRRLYRPPGSPSSNAVGGSYSGEEVDLANWLVMLSAARVDSLAADSEESCASASKENAGGDRLPVRVQKGLFECKGCKKIFSSHQALGGHRASHKKVKGCFAAQLDDVDTAFPVTNDDCPTPSSDNAGAGASLRFTLRPQTPPASGKRKSKVHECSICHRIFASGQALGGHKRCHWVTSSSAAASDQTANIANLLQQPFTTLPKLDLNMPVTAVNELQLLRREQKNYPFELEVSAPLYLQPWIKAPPISNINFNGEGSKINEEAVLGQVDQYSDADSKVKLAKLSDLKDINSGGSSSPWLQVGIGSSDADEESRVP